MNNGCRVLFNEAKELYILDNPHVEYLAYAIVEKRNNQVIGSVGCSAYEDLNEVGITYFIGGKYRRNNYATEAVKVFSQYFLDRYKDVQQLIATIRTANKASCKTVEKAGYHLKQTRMYKDINDTEEQEYNFYFYM